MLPDIDRVTRLIEEAAAAEVMPRFRKLAAHDVRGKAPGDLVTIADEAVEARLTPALTALLPGSIVIGEEAAAADPNLLDRLFDDSPAWIIDPVDGTANYITATICELTGNQPATACTPTIQQLEGNLAK